jgi:hypothetical protein
MVALILRRPKPVEGLVIPASLQKGVQGWGLALVACLVVLPLAAGLLIWHMEAGRINVLAISLIIGSGVALIASPFMFLNILRSRLVIGADRLQVIRGKASVVAQIPYKNMVGIMPHQNFLGFRVLGIDVADRCDRDTFWGFVHRGTRHHPFDMIINDFYSDPPEILAQKILAAYHRFTSQDERQS